MPHGHVRGNEMYDVMELLGQIGYFLVQAAHLGAERKGRITFILK